MAVETLNVNAVSAKANWSGTDADIFEDIAGADNTGLNNAAVEGDVLDLDLDNSIVVEGDTVTNISFVLRAQAPTNSSDGLTVQLLIGGVAQGIPVAFGTVPSTWGNSGLLNDVGWNVDRTAAEMDGAQARIVTTQAGMPGVVDLDFDCLDCIVTFTPAAAGASIPIAMYHHMKHNLG
jgi:hypothetical protein